MRSTFVVYCITGYSVLLSVSLVARALSIALRLQVHTKGGNIMICNSAARPHRQSVLCKRAERICIA